MQEVAPGLNLKVFGSEQALHDCPAADVNCPGPQDEQALELDPPVESPAGQAWHDVELETEENWPLAHAMQPELPKEGCAEPAGQAAHEDAPVLCICLPGWQRQHLFLHCGEVQPGVESLLTDDPQDAARPTGQP